MLTPGRETLLVNSARVAAVLLTFGAVGGITAGGGWSVLGVIVLLLAAALVALDVLVKDPQELLAKLKAKQAALIAGPDAHGPRDSRSARNR